MHMVLGDSCKWSFDPQRSLEMQAMETDLWVCLRLKLKIGLSGVEEPILPWEVPCYWLASQTVGREGSRLRTSIHLSLFPEHGLSVTSCLKFILPCLSCSDGPYLHTVSWNRPFLLQPLLLGILSRQRENQQIGQFTGNSAGRKDCMKGEGWGAGGMGGRVTGVLPLTFDVPWLKFSFVQAQGTTGSPQVTQTLLSSLWVSSGLLSRPASSETHNCPHTPKGRSPASLPSLFILHRPLSLPMPCELVKQC